MDKKGKHDRKTTSKQKSGTTALRPGIPLPKHLDIYNEEDQKLFYLLQPHTPEVVAPSSQISFAPPPKFHELDVVTENLTIQKELQYIRQFQSSIEKAREYIPFLYSYRSISKAINNDLLEPDQKILAKTLDGTLDKKKVFSIFSQVFEKTFQNLIELHDFADNSKNLIETAIMSIKEPSDLFFYYLTQFFEGLFNIDNLKLVKTGIVNDLAFSKRRYQGNTTDLSEEERAEKGQNDQKNMEINSWISSKNKTLVSLHEHYLKNKGLLSFYLKYLDYCVNSYNNHFLLPKEKHSLIIGITSALFIAGGQTNDINIFEQPSVKNALSIIEKNCIVPLYAENSFAPGYILAEADGFGTKDRGIATKAETIKAREADYLIKNKMNKYREMYRESLQITSALTRNQPFTEEDLLKLLYNMSDMANAITLQFAFKMVIVKQNDSTEKTFNYDRGVRLNYTPEDLDALIELIGYVKTLSANAIVAEERISDFVTKTANIKIQSFIVNELEKLMITCTGDQECLTILSNIRDAFGYWRGEAPPTPAAKKVKEFQERPISETCAFLTKNILEMLSLQVQDIIKPESLFCKKHGKFGKHLSTTKDLAVFHSFMKECQKYTNLINYSGHIRDSTNLGALWYREVFLDIDQIIQFPVRSSLPFILAEHLLKLANKPALHDSMMFPFEIYNDAASLALHTFHSQYLYREIEAEVSLCIDMISFTFSETFYKFAREKAAAIELPYNCVGKIIPMPNRYNLIVLQNKLTLLGSQVDFNDVTTKKLDAKLQKELESYIELLTDIRMAPYVAHLVRVARTTHHILVENHLLMEPFDMILQRATGFTQPLNINTRLASLLGKALDFQHYKFNSLTKRFVCTKELTINPTTTEQWASVYSSYHQADKTYIGSLHFKALAELMSSGEIGIFLQRVILILEEELTKFLEFYTGVAPTLRMLPPINRDELMSFYNFNSDAYHQFSHQALGQLFGNMRTIGNIIAFVWCLETEIEPSVNHNSILTPILEIVKDFLLDNFALFAQQPEIDLESTTHRSFASLWTILEFLICSPRNVKFGDSSQGIQPLSVFGDGPIICANLFIEICNQTPYTLFDSINHRSLELHTVEHTHMGQSEISQYLEYANYCEQAVTFARYLASPYKIERPIDA